MLYVSGFYNDLFEVTDTDDEVTEIVNESDLLKFLSCGFTVYGVVNSYSGRVKYYKSLTLGKLPKLEDIRYFMSNKVVNTDNSIYFEIYLAELLIGTKIVVSDKSTVDIVIKVDIDKWIYNGKTFKITDILTSKRCAVILGLLFYVNISIEVYVLSDKDVTKEKKCLILGGS